MKKIIINFLLLVISCFFVSSVSLADKKILRLGTASRGGGYYELGNSIKNLLIKKGYSVIVIPTKGSVDNVLRLERKELDLAIVQNDIAYFSGYGLYPFDHKIKTVKSIMPFYVEPIFLLTNDSNIRSVHDLSGKRVNVGERGSGLYVDARFFLMANELWDVIDRKNESAENVYNLLANDKIDISFTNDLTKDLLRGVNDNKLFMLSLNSEDIGALKSTYPYFSEYNSNLSGKEFRTIAVRALLVAHEDVSSEIIYEITSCLYDNYAGLIFPGGPIISKAPDISGVPVIKRHKGAERYYLKKGLVSSQFLLRFLWVVAFSVSLFLIAVFVVNLLTFYFKTSIGDYIRSQKAFFAYIKKINLVLIRNKYVLILIIIMALFMLDLFIIQYVEHDWAIRHNKMSKFDNKSFLDNVIWMFVFSGSGYNDDLFPVSSIGKTLVTLIPLISYGGLVAFFATFATEKIKTMISDARGSNLKGLKSHIIICGYNKSTSSLIRDIVKYQIEEERSVVLLAPLGDKPGIQQDILDMRQFEYINGSAINKCDLDRVCFQDAEIAVVVADEGIEEPDSVTILKILTVEKYFKELNEIVGRKRKDIYTIAEIHNEQYIGIAKDAGVDEVIGLSGFKSKIIAQSILNPGVSVFFKDLLTFDDCNEMYSLSITEKYADLLGRNYDELLNILRLYDVLLLSINRIMCSDCLGVDEKNILEKEHMRHVITNPVTKEEKEYRIKDGDVLIVLAKDQKAIKYVKNVLQSASELKNRRVYKARS